VQHMLHCMSQYNIGMLGKGDGAHTVKPEDGICKLSIRIHLVI
jgi:hypothetical protein